MSRAVNHLLVIVTLLLVVGCSGGGCSSGCAAGGLTPLAHGFDSTSRIENAASVRLTQSGLQFLQDNVGTLASTLLGSSGSGGGAATFPVPSSSGSVLGIDYGICPNGPTTNPLTCTAEVDLANAQLQIATTSPHDITVTGPLPVRLQDLPLHIKYACVPLLGCLESDIHITLTGNDQCPGGSQTFADLPLDVDVSIEVDNNQQHSFYGYSRVNILKVDVDKNALSNALKFCGSIDATIFNTVKGLAVDLLYGQLIGQLTSQIDQQLCQKANPMLSPTCPDGTNDVNGICRYGTQDTDQCASVVLGVSGHVDLGQLLATLSPGTKGGLDILLAGGGADLRDDNSGFAWGDLNPIGGGATLGLYGGALPNPMSKCVKTVPITPPSGIPIPDELIANTVTNWPADIPGPHVGVALSERYMNYALTGVFNSGLLCIGVSGDVQPLLNSGTVSLIAGSLTTLTLQQERAQMALMVRPGAPPQVTVGNGTDPKTDPLLRVSLKQLSLDFYIWSLDRFIRAMTLTFDIDVPVNLTVGPMGLEPMLSGDAAKVTNASVTNSQLLRESPDAIAKALQGFVGTAIGQALGGGIPPIDLSKTLASTGLNLIIPDTVMGQGSPGLRKLTKGTDNFLGVFASLALAMPAANQSKTSAEIVDKSVDAAGLRLATITESNVPSVHLRVGSNLDDGAHALEYQYKLDGGAWNPYTQSRDITVQSEWLRLEGRHTIAVRSRVVGQPLTVDRTPAVVSFGIDATPPVVHIAQSGDGTASIDVTDLVSDTDHALVRVRLDGGAWSPWKAASEMRTVDVRKAMHIDVEAKDEDNNVGTAQQMLIRGAPSKTASAACGCSVPGDPSPASRAWPFALIAAFLAAARRLRPRRRAPVARASVDRELRRVAIAVGVMGTLGSFAGCSCGDESTAPSQCVAPGCKSLEAGLIGEYTSAAVAGDGTVWVAGYLEGDYKDLAHPYHYGDLVVGKWDDGSGRVIWNLVDGVPSDPPVDSSKFDVNGFRGGQTEPGPDVGLWTSIALDGSGNPAVAYYDRTNKALKFAQLAGDQWVVSQVDGGAGMNAGRYAKLLFVGGNPVVAYLTVTAATAPGFASSSIRVAKATTSSPMSAADWQIEDAIKSDAPCRADLCPTGSVCVTSTLKCTTPAKSCGDCGPGNACITPEGGGTAACVATIDLNKIDGYPAAAGDYIALATDPKGALGLAFYDRPNGNMVVASNTSGKWTQTIVDGQTGSTDTGDMGIGATLFIDASGDWHVAYVDGWAEALMYATIKQGTTVVTPEIVDDGLGVGPDPFADGQHLVGDDANIFVTSSGEIHITYQDATAGTLHYAVGTPSSSAHTWTVKVIDQTDRFAGAFSRVLQGSGMLRLMNWWRVGGDAPAGDVAIVTP